MARNLRTLTVKEVVERTGMPYGTVLRYVRAGKLAAIRLGERGTIRVLESSLEALVDQALDATQPQERKSSRVVDDVDAAILPDGPRHFA